MPEAIRTLKTYEKPQLQHHDFDSSQIREYEYDGASQTLYMRFNSNYQTLTYAYAGFPPEKAEALDAAESKGSFFYQHIKNKYEFDRLPGAGAPADEAAA